ncbi:MAG: agmatinase family protein [Pseudomonadota bacterium]
MMYVKSLAALFFSLSCAAASLAQAQQTEPAPSQDKADGEDAELKLPRFLLKDDTQKADEEKKDKPNPLKDLEYTPSKDGEVPVHIDAATPGMMERPPLELPEDVAARITFLPEDTISYLKSGKTNAIVRPDKMFKKILAAQSDEQIIAYIKAIMSVDDQMTYKEGRDKASIALDTQAANFNTWRSLRPAELDPAREAGPIALSRYMGGRGGGIPTFAGAPLAKTPEDLIAGEVEVAIVGAPLDMGSGWRDARHGPLAMRVMGRGLGGTDVATMINPGEALNIVDYGDIAIDQMSTERSMKEVRRVVGEIAKTGAVPFIIGGDHSLEYPNVAAMADVYGKGKVGVIHFDAHLDTGRGRPHLMSHGQPIYRLMREAHVRPEDYIQVGLRAHYSKQYYEWQRLIGMRYHTMAEVERRGWDAVLDRVLMEASENTEYLYISFDVDVLDPAFEPGTGTPVSGGLDMREAITIVRRLCAESNVIGFDLVELAPEIDPTYRSTLNANSLVFACLTGMAMRKQGIEDPHFISDLSSDHSRNDFYEEKNRKSDRQTTEDKQGDKK